MNGELHGAPIAAHGSLLTIGTFVYLLTFTIHHLLASHFERFDLAER